MAYIKTIVCLLEASALEQGVQLIFIRSGRPMENGFVEDFNGRLRDECLNVERFTSLEDTRRKLATWRYHYNHERPHSAWKNQTPASVAETHRTEMERRFAFPKYRQQWSTFIGSLECTKPGFHAARGRGLDGQIV